MLTLTPIAPNRRTRESRSEWEANEEMRAKHEAQTLIPSLQTRAGFNHDMHDDMMNFSLAVDWDTV